MEVDMQVRFTNEMLKAIAQHVHDASTTRGILDVYKAAEIIRLDNIADNVAREDIIEKLVLLAGSAFVPVEFNSNAFASEGACYDSTVYLTNDSFMDSLMETESVH
jgi:hypothetical protein